MPNCQSYDDTGNPSLNEQDRTSPQTASKCYRKGGAMVHYVNLRPASHTLILSNPNDVSPAASNLFFGVPFFEGGALGLRAIAGPKQARCKGWFGVQFL